MQLCFDVWRIPASLLLLLVPFLSLKPSPSVRNSQSYRPSDQGECPSSPGRSLSVPSVLSPSPLSFPYRSFSFHIFSSSHPGEAPSSARPTTRASLSRQRHVSLLLSLHHYPRLTPIAITLHNNILANPPRTYRAPSTNHLLLFALRPTPRPPFPLLQTVSRHNLPNSCHRNTNRRPPNLNHNPLHSNNNSHGLSIHGLLVA